MEVRQILVENIDDIENDAWRAIPRTGTVGVTVLRYGRHSRVKYLFNRQN